MADRFAHHRQRQPILDRNGSRPMAPCPATIVAAHGKRAERSDRLPESNLRSAGRDAADGKIIGNRTIDHAGRESNGEHRIGEPEPRAEPRVQATTYTEFIRPTRRPLLLAATVQDADGGAILQRHRERRRDDRAESHARRAPNEVAGPASGADRRERRIGSREKSPSFIFSGNSEGQEAAPPMRDEGGSRRGVAMFGRY